MPSVGARHAEELGVRQRLVLAAVGARGSPRRSTSPPTTPTGARPGFTGEGGSIPFLASLGKRYPDVQFVATGVMGPQSNAHAIDEFLDLPMTVGITNSVITVLSAHAKS